MVPIPDFYKELSECRLNENEWEICPKCLCRPRIWIFDNGEFAKCGCNQMYDKASAQGISIWDYHKMNNGNMTDWNHNNLRDNWNRVVKDRKIGFFGF